jgi:pimeloyl-ACP methyl ester carboxylesterase
MPPLGSFTQVGGHRLFMDRRGEATPTVVFLPGAGLAALDYLAMHQPASERWTSLLYDRAGTGYSQRIPLPRTAEAVTDELDELLEACGAEPVLLLGHSLGGLYARHYANRFPDQTLGLVLLDPAHEDYDAYMPAQLVQARSANLSIEVLNRIVDLAMSTPPTKALLGALPPVRRYQRTYRKLFEAEMANWPANIREGLVASHTSLDWLAVGLREARALDDLYAEVRRCGPMPPVPTVILSSITNDGFRQAVSPDEPEDLLEEESKAKARLYADIIQGVPRGEVRPVDTGHVTMAFRGIDAVLDAISSIVE